MTQRPCLAPFLCNHKGNIAIDRHFEYLDTIFECGHYDCKGKAQKDAIVESPIFPPNADKTAEIMKWMQGGSQRIMILECNEVELSQSDVLHLRRL